MAHAKKKPLPQKTLALLAAFILLAGGLCVWLMNRNGETAVPDMTPTHTAVIEIASYGTITAELYGNMAPITVENFVKLANDGFYDGLTFHRIIEGFMMQGGCPLGTGTGGADKNIKGEFVQNGVNNSISHTRGVLSMARSALPNSASSQFFIMHQDGTYLDGSYAAFGRVTEGMDVVDAICESAAGGDQNGVLPKANQPQILSIRCTPLQ